MKTRQEKKIQWHKSLYIIYSPVYAIAYLSLSCFLSPTQLNERQALRKRYNHNNKYILPGFLRHLLSIRNAFIVMIFCPVPSSPSRCFFFLPLTFIFPLRVLGGAREKCNLDASCAILPFRPFFFFTFSLSLPLFVAVIPLPCFMPCWNHISEENLAKNVYRNALVFIANK